MAVTDTSEIFCDSCDVKVYRSVLNIFVDELSTTDYIGGERVLNNVPIFNEYLSTIDTEKYCVDEIINEKFNCAEMKKYSSLLPNRRISFERSTELSRLLIGRTILDSLKKTSSYWTYINVSKPVYSLNGRFVIVEVDKICYGLCGGGFACILENTNGNWVLYKKIDRWIS